MKTSCVLALLPLLCGLARAQGQPPPDLVDEIRELFKNITNSATAPVTSPSTTTPQPRGVPCPFVDVRSEWLKSAYAAGEDICPIRCCTRFGALGLSGGCLRNGDYTVYNCCNETHERVKVNVLYVCQPPSNFTEVKQPNFAKSVFCAKGQCPEEFLDNYPDGYTQDSFLNDASELCPGNCFWSTGEVEPPYYYYEFVDCCQGWTKLRGEDGKYLCRCDGRLYRRSRGRRLRCRPTRG